MGYVDVFPYLSAVESVGLVYLGLATGFRARYENNFKDLQGLQHPLQGWSVAMWLMASERLHCSYKGMDSYGRNTQGTMGHLQNEKVLSGKGNGLPPVF